MNRLGRAGRQTISVVAILVALGAAFVWRQISGPSDGAWLTPSRAAWTEEGVTVSPLVPRSGLRDGDVVISVDGVPLETLASTLAQPWQGRPRWTSGQVVVYTVQRDGLHTVVPVTLGRYPLRVVLARLSGRLEAVVAPEAVLPAIVETIAQTLKLSYAAVALRRAVAVK